MAELPPRRTWVRVDVGKKIGLLVLLLQEVQLREVARWEYQTSVLCRMCAVIRCHLLGQGQLRWPVGDAAESG